MIAISRPPKFTPFDEWTFCGMSQMIKAAIPYIHGSSARMMAMAARLLELRNTLEYFNHPGQLAACALGSRRPSTEEMLSDLRKYCDGTEAETIDKLLGVMKMGKFYEKFKDLEKNFSKESSSNGGKSSMDHEFNTEMFKNFDMNKFNQMLAAMNSQQQNVSKTPEPPKNPGYDTEQLKALLTPEQQRMFEAITASMGKKEQL